MFPCAYILMTSKSVSAYNAVLNVINDEVALHVNPTHVMTDYEAALQTVVQQQFPNAQVQGCWFHFTQVGLVLLLKFFTQPSIYENPNFVCVSVCVSGTLGGHAHILLVNFNSRISL